MEVDTGLWTRMPVLTVQTGWDISLSSSLVFNSWLRKYLDILQQSYSMVHHSPYLGRWLNQFHLPGPAKYVYCLWTSMSHLFPAGPIRQNVPSYIPNNINIWMHVFVRNDRILSELRLPYSTPYKMIKKEQKYLFLILVGNEILSLLIAYKMHSLKRIY